jgi:hypothetical protein
MYYTVSARLKTERAGEFLVRLADGSIQRQEPDGEEIVASMQRARVDETGIVRWSEVCYCPTPLQHERETVYDHFFTDLETQEAVAYVHFDGEPFLDYLQRAAKSE